MVTMNSRTYTFDVLVLLFTK